MPKTLIEIQREFDNIRELPTLPIVAVKLLELLRDDNSTLKEITDVMSIDPPIATTVLKVANSVLYALPQRVDSLRRAFVILGANEITNIVLSVSFARTFPWTKGSIYFDRKKYWEHSVVTGYITRLLAKELGIVTHGEEYTAGLIHDIGKIIMDQFFHKEFVQVINLI
ncbi:MAG: HDOD domain-containing protein, partial [Candidatus Cloacimonetes bacterium]|nr:HDOD domain-containing protein [Candidatus Cloacimonadota bacterium]